MIAGVGSCGSWEDPCSLDQWDPSIPWCGHVLLMKGVFFGPKFGPQIWDGPNTGVFKQICMICSSRDWSKCGCGWCGCGCLSGAEYDRSMTSMSGAVQVFFGMGRICCTAQTRDEGHGRFRIQPSKFGWYPLMKTLILQVPIHLMVPVVYIYIYIDNPL